jgi:predicted Fe-S protein YdhL (DUF1289 family)
MDKTNKDNKKERKEELENKLRNEWKTMSNKERSEVINEYARINGVDPNKPLPKSIMY